MTPAQKARLASLRERGTLNRAEALEYHELLKLEELKTAVTPAQPKAPVQGTDDEGGIKSVVKRLRRHVVKN